MHAAINLPLLLGGGGGIDSGIDGLEDTRPRNRPRSGIRKRRSAWRGRLRRVRVEASTGPPVPYCAISPPSMISSAPVTNEDSSEAR